MTLHVERTKDEATCFALRKAVFTDEQGIAVELDIDGSDVGAVQFLATLDGQPIGTARYLIAGQAAKIGRVCVLKAYRGKGIGVALIRAAMDDARQAGLTEARLGAQETAIGFYEQLGFVPEGEVFLDVDIPHRMMTASL